MLIRQTTKRDKQLYVRYLLHAASVPLCYVPSPEAHVWYEPVDFQLYPTCLACGYMPTPGTILPVIGYTVNMNGMATTAILYERY